jgi:hypothetical protein
MMQPHFIAIAPQNKRASSVKWMTFVRRKSRMHSSIRWSLGGSGQCDVRNFTGCRFHYEIEISFAGPVHPSRVKDLKAERKRSSNPVTENYSQSSVKIPGCSGLCQFLLQGRGADAWVKKNGRADNHLKCESFEPIAASLLPS